MEQRNEKELAHMRRLMSAVLHGGSGYDALRRMQNEDDKNKVNLEKQKYLAQIRKEQPGEQVWVERGMETVQLVIDALSPISWVDDLVETNFNDTYDRTGIDLVAYVTRPLVEMVNIQVKSTNNGVGRFKSHQRKKHRLKQSEYPQWLIQNNFFIINGRKPADEIQNSFITSVNAMVRYQHTIRGIQMLPGSTHILESNTHYGTK